MTAKEVELRVRTAVRDLAAVGLRIEALSCSIHTSMEIEDTMMSVVIVNKGDLMDLTHMPARTLCGIPWIVTP